MKIKNLVFEVIIFAVGIAFVVLLYKNNIGLAVLLFGLFIVGNRLWHEKNDIMFYLVGMLIGTVSEVIAVQFGVWQYANPTFWGIPIWLPFAWGLAVLLIMRVAQTIINLQKAK